jgi:hypothetical protein
MEELRCEEEMAVVPDSVRVHERGGPWLRTAAFMNPAFAGTTGLHSRSPGRLQP